METKKITENTPLTEEIKAESFEFLRKIDWIIKSIRECNLGSLSQITKEEKETSVSIERVEFPAEGGVLTYYEGIPFPSKGFPYTETVETVDRVKKMYTCVMKRTFYMFNRNKIKIVLLLFFLRNELIEIATTFLETLNHSLRLVRQKPEMYCPMARELYRTFKVISDKEKDIKTKEILDNLRDIVCMTFEYDDAYRYRFQNEMYNLNKDNVRKDLVNELRRLLKIAIIGENKVNVGIGVKYEMFLKLLIILRFKKNVREIMKSFILELNLDKIKLDEGDKYQCKYKGIKPYEEEEEKKVSKQKDDKSNLIYKEKRVWQEAK